MAKPKKPRVSAHPPKVRTEETLALIDRLRAICMELPGVTEQIAWGEPTWRAPKIFAMTDTYHHGSPHLSVHLPAPPGAQAALVDSDPARFFKPPYTGGKGWVGVVLDTRPDWEMVASLVRTAYDLIRDKGRRGDPGRAPARAGRGPTTARSGGAGDRAPRRRAVRRRRGPRDARPVG